ncbi:LysR substrate-binding domain-containing protein [Bradyrhizobium sp. 27S5]|uniref:LysR substrate-binding domain-containing protein n=1 Tax=Bradyrhizobium sp. 27S5 TaxID=3139728 RepID=UPI0030D2D457
MRNLDMDILRTLVAAQDLGGFNRAADQVGRSQSAVSQQVRKLEEQVGEALFRKEGRGLVPTEAGDVILRYARRILDLNDEAIAAVRGIAIAGTVRFGLPSDLAETWLPKVLGHFKRAHPAVLIEVVVERNALLLERLDKGQLDLAIAFGGGPRADAHQLAELPMTWIGPVPKESVIKTSEPISLVVYSPPCFFRQASIDALDKAGIAWHTSFTSTSLHGLWAAVDAGLGITLRTVVGLPRSLTVLHESSGLPPAPTIRLALHDAGRELSPAAERLKAILVETLADSLHGANRALAR